MRRLLFYLIPWIFIGSTLTLSAQEGNKGLIRIEDKRVVIQLDLNKLPKDVTDVGKILGLDSLQVAHLLSGTLDSTLTANGWTQKLEKGMLELSRNLADIPSAIQSFNDVFLLNDDWLGMNWNPEPEEAVYGLNSFENDGQFMYDDSVATFLLPGYEKARTVYLSGTFNNWSTGDTPMNKIDGGWSTSLILPPGKFLYKFIIDGKWTTDPTNKLREKDQDGEMNSVVYLYNYSFHLDGYTQARRVILTGSFNGWNEREIRMAPTNEGWQVRMYLRTGTYGYKFIVDREWTTDPANPVVRHDAYGNANSFMSIGDTTWFRLDGYRNARQVTMAGNFNNWDGSALVMDRTDKGWELPYVVGEGNWEYKFIVDGNWMPDPANPYTIGEGDYANSLRVVHPTHTFTFKSDSNVSTVTLSGTFNGWSKSGYKLIKDGDTWKLPLHLRKGKHLYKFIVNGQWIIDPANPYWEENEHGTGNSVLWIE